MAITVLEALRESVVIPNVSDKALEKALIDAGLTGTDNYSASNKDAVTSAAVSVLTSLPVSSITEGGYSVTFDRKAIEDNINLLTGNGKRGVEVLNI